MSLPKGLGLFDKLPAELFNQIWEPLFNMASCEGFGDWQAHNNPWLTDEGLLADDEGATFELNSVLAAVPWSAHEYFLSGVIARTEWHFSGLWSFESFLDSAAYFVASPEQHITQLHLTWEDAVMGTDESGMAQLLEKISSDSRLSNLQSVVFEFPDLSLKIGWQRVWHHADEVNDHDAFDSIVAALKRIRVCEAIVFGLASTDLNTELKATMMGLDADEYKAASNKNWDDYRESQAEESDDVAE